MSLNRSFYIVLITIAIFLSGCSRDGDEPLPVVNASVIASEGVLEEGNTTGFFKVNIDAKLNVPINLIVSFKGNAQNGIDFEEIPGSISIPANQTQATIRIDPINDSITEEIENITITLLGSDSKSIIISGDSVASVSISDPSGHFLPLPGQIRSYLANPNVTEETAALFYNLKLLSRTQFIVGQQDAFSSFYNNIGGDSDIKKTTGSNPGLLGSDFMFITDDKNNESSSNWFYQQEMQIKEDIIAAYNEGMVNILVWHLREPYQGEEFYTANMSDFQKENAMKSILPGGANHEYYKTKLKKVGDFANGLNSPNGTKIPIIFRPFHEFDGDWFWWGKSYCTAEEFKTIWQFTVNYLTNELNVNNILFAYSPDSKLLSADNYLSRYPGDDYVDLLGMDNYQDFRSGNQADLNKANSKLQIVSTLAGEKVKIAALTESCDFRSSSETGEDFYSADLYNTLTKNQVELAFMMFWSNNESTYCTPPPGLMDSHDFIEFTDKSDVLLSKNLPYLYKMPIQ